MSNKVKLSIIIPVYNGEKYLVPLLESIAAQSLKNFEVIAVDDDSTDSSVKILNSYKEKIPNLSIISQENSGVSVARNNGIEKSCGEYICFCDADDVISPDYVKVFCEQMKEIVADVIVADYKTFYGNIDTKNYGVQNLNSEILAFSASSELVSILSKLGLLTQLWNKAYRADLIKNNGVKLTVGSTYGEDMFFNWKVLLIAQSAVRIKTPLYFYRLIESSASVKYHKNLYQSYKKEYGILSEFSKQVGCDENEMQNEIYINLAERLPALLRMAHRAKKGIKYSLGEVKSFSQDEFMKTAAKYVCTLDDTHVKSDIKKLCRKVVNNKSFSLWLYGYKNEMRIVLARKIKNLRGK